MFGPYRIVGLLGQGETATVYEAHDTSKDRVVALKILDEQYCTDPRNRERFRRQAQAAAKLPEPHIIPVHGWGEIDGRLYIDMRLVQGSTLHDLIASGPLQPPRAVSIISQIATALDAAHAQGVIHRDIKPQNVIVTGGDFAYLLDFGIAEAAGESRLTVDSSHAAAFDYTDPDSDAEATAAAESFV